MLRKISFIITLLCSITQQTAQPIMLPKEIGSITFYGIDFTQVNLVGTDESANYFIRAFNGINRLFTTEMRKYNVEKATKMEVSEYNFDMVNDINAETNIDNARTMKPVRLSDEELASHIASLPVAGSGTGLIIVADCLDKNRNCGGFHFVFFDRSTHAIIASSYIEGAPGGFGLRNYWATSVRNAMKRIKIKRD